MNRSARFLAAFVLCSAAACTSTPDKVSIQAFQANPDSIEAGQTAMLHVAVDPPDALVTITELGDMADQREIPVRPTSTTTYHLTATSGTAQAEAAVTVSVAPQPVITIRMQTSSDNSVAGESLGVTLTAIGANGLPTLSYRGTVHLTSSDGAASLPADLTFGVSDGGVMQTKVQLRTAGLNVISAMDTASPGLIGVAPVMVKPAAAATCATSQAPASTMAGATFGMSVGLRDPFGNLATTYTGTMHLSSTDVRAPAPSDVTFSAADGGSHAFSAVLVTSGVQTLTVTDVANAALQCSATVAVGPGAPKIVLTMPDSAKAGFPINVGVQVRDLFDNPIPGYAGTITFTSTDSAATAPSPITFTGSEGGTGSTSATFLTRGMQVLNAQDSGTPVATGSAAAAVMGLVYTGPSTGRVRLVANAASSTSQVIQLDLIANERLEVSTFFGGGPGSFAAGMNLPLDTTRVGADTTLFTRGNALPAGTGAAVQGAAIGNDHILYTVVGRKRATGPVFSQETEVQAGQVFYSVRLALAATATAGNVFDGAQLGAMFRASVRDQYGDDFVGQSDFGIGKLDVQ